MVWESSDAETLTYLSLRHSALGVHLQNVGKIPRFRPAGPERGRFGGTERQVGAFLGVAPESGFLRSCSLDTYETVVLALAII